MRILTWNCCKGPYEKKLAYLRGLALDVAVLQECPRPPAADGDVLWFGENPNQGVAVVAAGDFAIEPLPHSSGAPAFVLPFRVTGPVAFNLVAVWALPEPNYVEYVRRGLTAYGDLLRSGPAVVAGDFNSSAVFDRRHPQYSHSDLVAHLGRLGLVSSYHRFFGEEHGQESQATHHWRWQAENPFHLDYCFVPEDWAGRLDSVAVGGFEDGAPLSDHRPLIVDLLV